MATAPDGTPDKASHSHVWRNRDSALPCTPTGEEGLDADGRAYAWVVTPSGDKNFVPKDELRTVAAWKKELKVSAQKASAPLKITAAESARLDTWMTDFTTSVQGTGREEAGSDWRFGSNDALVLHPKGFWHSFSSGSGGYGALSLLAHLHGGEEAGLRVAQAWLAQHAGAGRFASGDAHVEDEDAAASLLDAKNEAYIDALFLRAQPITASSAAMAYFAARQLDIISTGAESQLRWLPDWRGDEGAVLAAISGNAGELVALQLLHITPAGEKSTIQPVRKLLRGPQDWRQRGAFRLGEPAAFKRVLVEGVEDAVAAAMAGAESVLACLGVGGIGRAEIPLPAFAVVARDDDPPGSKASLALGRSVARLLLHGCEVSITARAGTLHPGAKDFNDLLRVDVALARQFLDSAKGVADRLDGAEREALLEETSKASRDAYERNRKAIATALHWRTGPLDEERSRRRQARAQQGTDPVTRVVELEPWPQPVDDIGAVLDAAVAQVKRFLVVPDKTYADSMALWGAHAHLLHREELGVGFTPRLAFQSPTKRCGKSTALKCVYLMAHHPRMASSISPSSLFRAVDAFTVSVFVDEGDNVFKTASPELLAVINSGADRMTAKVMRTEAVGDGKFEAREFNCFAAVALTSIQEVPDTLQDRCIVLPLRRATKDERPERLTLRTRGELIDIGRRFSRWGADLETLPEPDLPADLFNRVEDKWFVLFQIAQLAGGTWPERCKAAALADLKREEASDAEGGLEGDLLADVWRVFYEKVVVELHTKELCAALNAMEEAPWCTAKRGQPIDGNYLHRHLRDFIPGEAEAIAPRKFYVGGVQMRGYHERHFEDAFSRYLGKPLPSEARQAEARKKAQAGPMPSPGGSKRPSHPSHPSQRLKSEDASVGYNKTGALSLGVLTPSQQPSDATDNAPQDGHKTGAETQAVLQNNKRDQLLKPKQDGQDGQDGRGDTPGESIPPRPPGLPRGTRKLERKQPGKGATSDE